MVIVTVIIRNNSASAHVRVIFCEYIYIYIYKIRKFYMDEKWQYVYHKLPSKNQIHIIIAFVTFVSSTQVKLKISYLP